jgi:hypothetical protein
VQEEVKAILPILEQRKGEQIEVTYKLSAFIASQSKELMTLLVNLPKTIVADILERTVRYNKTEIEEQADKEGVDALPTTELPSNIELQEDQKEEVKTPCATGLFDYLDFLKDEITELSGLINIKDSEFTSAS